MPPTFRTSRSGRQFGDGVNRTRTGQIDHDVTEGLPVRRWTRQSQTVSQEPKAEGAESEVHGHTGKQSIPEHPMPRDSHLLSPMSRALLRAARSGCIYIRPASKEFEDDDKETTDLEEQQTQQNLERNLYMRKWTTVPRHLEAPEVEFLAKRRPGLPSIYAAPGAGADGANGLGAMRKTRFKKVDPATGNISVYAAWVPEGHKIEGEVADEAQLIAENSKVVVIPEAPAPGTVIEGVGVVNAQGVVVAEAGSAAVLTPPRRRPPPPKRKGKGLKGRRKKVMFAPGEGADASLIHTGGPNANNNTTNYGKETDSLRMSVDQTTQDDEDDEGEEGEESDDGEGDESGLDAKTPEAPGPQASTEPGIESNPGPATEQPSTSIPAILELHTKAQAPQVPRPKPSSKSRQPPAPSTAVSHSETGTPENSSLAEPAHTKEPAEGAPVLLLPISSDVQMTDAEPTDEPVLSPQVSSSEAQITAAPAVAQPVSQGKSLSPVHEARQPLAFDLPQARAGNIEQSTNRQAAEHTDVSLAAPDVSIPEPSHDVLAEALQRSVSSHVHRDELIHQQPEQPRMRNEFDLLDNLEASLTKVPNERPNEEQEASKPDPQSEIALTQNAAENPAVPMQAPADVHIETKLAEAATKTKDVTQEEPMAPPVEELTPPDLEHTVGQDPAKDLAEQQLPPPTEHKQPGYVSEAPAQPVPTSSERPFLKSEITHPKEEQSKQIPQETGSEHTPLAPGAERSRQESDLEHVAEQLVAANAHSKVLASHEQQLKAAPESSAQPAAEPTVKHVPDSALEQPQHIVENPTPTLSSHRDTPNLPTGPAAEQHIDGITATGAQALDASGDGPTLHGARQP
ncbi:hypothetical protein BJX70DRAFT_369286 [Aspergillus crustosus]